MNSVSWFVYLASIMDRLGSVVFFTSIACALALIATLIAFVASRIQWSDDTYVSEYDDKKRRYVKTKIEVSDEAYIWKQISSRTYWRWVFVLLVAVNIANVFRPSRETMYAIAASEVGERVVQSEAVRGLASDATTALQHWIKRQIEPQK